MAKRIEWSERTIEQMVREGYGKGTGERYKPWLLVDSFSSLGRARRIMGLITNRTHHLLSDAEHHFFVLAEHQKGVTDIREQYPLDRNVTMEIAKTLGIRHPYYPGTDVPAVMTLDFLVFGSSGPTAFNVKTDEEAEDERSLDKLEIQRSYFEAMDIPHHLIFKSQLPQNLIKNLNWIRDASLKSDEIEPFTGFFSDACTRMELELVKNSKNHSNIGSYCQKFDELFGYEKGTAIRVLRMLLKQRRIHTNLNADNLLALPLSDVHTKNPSLKVVKGGW